MNSPTESPILYGYADVYIVLRRRTGQSGRQTEVHTGPRSALLQARTTAQSWHGGTAQISISLDISAWIISRMNTQCSLSGPSPIMGLGLSASPSLPQNAEFPCACQALLRTQGSHKHLSLAGDLRQAAQAVFPLVNCPATLRLYEATSSLGQPSCNIEGRLQSDVPK